MGNRPLPKLCVFCAGDATLGPMNKEHFAFKGLWGGPRPTRTKTVWAHESCNANFSADNEYFRDVLVMDAGAEQHPEVARLLKGKIHRKLRDHPGAILKILKNPRLIPQFTPSGLYVGKVPAFIVDWLRMERVLKNFVRGIYLTAVRQPLPADCLVAVAPLTQALAKDWRDMIDLMVGWQSFGDDVFMCRYVTSRTPPRINCLMQFYRRRLFVGEAMTKNLIDEINSGRSHARAGSPR
jgi:hypothetical protein